MSNKKNIFQRVKEAEEKRNKLQMFIDRKQTQFWDEAEVWYELKKEGYYKYVNFLGEDEIANRTFSGFVEEVGEPLTTVQLKIKLYEIWVEGLKFSKREMSRYSVKKLNISKASRYINKILNSDNPRDKAKELLSSIETKGLKEFKEYIENEY